MPGSGDFVSFFRPGGRSFALKSCPQGGDFDGKIVAGESSRGGGGGGNGNRSKIDTCIKKG